MNKNVFPIPSKKALKKLGYLKDQKGIVNRYLLGGEWKEHLDKTKNFIINSLNNQDCDVISVLGSGWFLDLPIDFLLERFEKIYCFDINHPRQITHKYKKENKIEFVESDVTGGIIDKLYQTKNIRIEDIPVIRSEEMEGIVISLNLMSQLDNLLFEHSNIEKTDEKKIREQIQMNHFKFLTSHPYLLITDFEETYFDDKGDKIGVKPTIHINLPKSEIAEEWIWRFDTNKTYKTDCNTDLNVIAISNL